MTYLSKGNSMHKKEPGFRANQYVFIVALPLPAGGPGKRDQNSLSFRFPSDTRGADDQSK